LRAALVALLVAATLGALAGWLTSRWVSRRLVDLDRTAARVGAGELGLRVALDGTHDAFDRLARRFNGMLDRIEDLLGGVRHATDHIAHDLRTPLTRLRNRLEDLRSRESATPADRAALDAAVQETDQLLQTFGALLRLARIEAQPPAQGPALAFDELVADAVELYTPIGGERAVRLRVELQPAAVRGDRDQLFQMLVNLLDNALKFAPHGSEVVLSLRAVANTVELCLDDDGPGIPESERERVFDRFQRLEAHRGTPGSGLGLSLVRAIVQRHGGQVVLVDRAPGLRVQVTLPLA
jgi:signal transduction histidine kinase